MVSEPNRPVRIAELSSADAERCRLVYGAATPERWEQRRAEHRAIIDAAAAGDGDVAARHLAAHYAQTAAFIFAALDPGHDLARLRTTIATVAPGAEDALTVTAPA